MAYRTFGAKCWRHVARSPSSVRFVQVSHVVVTLCVYGGFWSGLDAN